MPLVGPWTFGITAKAALGALACGAWLVAAAAGAEVARGPAPNRVQSPIPFVPRALAQDALALAEDHGLERLFPDQRQAAVFSDAQVTAELVRFIAALRRGSVDAAALGRDWAIPHPATNAQPIPTDALAPGNLRDAIDAAAPRGVEYRRLMEALRRYRSIRDAGGWRELRGSAPQFESDDVLIAQLSERLSAEGYGSVDAAGTGQLITRIRAFQRAHGIEADGRVGPVTLAEFNMPVERRIAQIAVNMERWRVLPRDMEGGRIVVNAAAATLELFEDDAVVDQMRVIVGDKKHPTPTFNATVTGITFNPVWRVPASIAAREMLPRLKRNPRYLHDNDIVIVGRDGDPSGLDLDWSRYSPGNFPFQLQQRPGIRNSLGLIKFEMSNPFDIYLHDTSRSTTSLFARADRNLSHGCVRLERPEELAARVLLRYGNGTETEPAVLVAAGATTTVRLARPLPVYVLYLSAFVDENDVVNFRRDIYGRDQAIESALGFNRQALDMGPDQADIIGSCA